MTLLCDTSISFAQAKTSLTSLLLVDAGSYQLFATAPLGTHRLQQPCSPTGTCGKATRCACCVAASNSSAALVHLSLLNSQARALLVQLGIRGNMWLHTRSYPAFHKPQAKRCHFVCLSRGVALLSGSISIRTTTCQGGLPNKLQKTSRRTEKAKVPYAIL